MKPAVNASPNVDFFVLEGEDETDNLIKGIQAGTSSERVLMISGDLTLITPEALDDLFDNAPDVDIVFPVVEQMDIEQRFGNREGWVYLKTPKGSFTGSSCFFFRRQAVLDRVEWVRKVFQSRRSRLKLARLWGPGFILKFVFGRLTLEDAANTAGRILGLSGRAYVSRYPELAMDLDHAGDIAIMQKELAGREDK